MRTHLIAGLLALTAQVWAGTATINIDTTRPGPKLKPSMYGIFLEEINHGVDGGLYAELIANRAFEDSRPPEEQAMLQRATSNKGFHYYGEGRFFILLGKAFAETMQELMGNGSKGVAERLDAPKNI